MSIPVTIQHSGFDTWAAAESTSNTLLRNAYTTFLGAVTAVGLYQQYDLNKKQVDLQERGVDLAEAQYALTLRNFEDIIVPTWEKGCDYWTRYRDCFEDYEKQYAKEAFSKKEYEADYCLQQGRAISTVQQQYDVLRRQRRRARGKYYTGQSCYEDLQIMHSAAMARVSAANTAYRYEDAKKLRLDEWYWQRCTQATQLSQQVGSLGANMLNFGVSGVSSGLQNLQRSFGAQLGAFEQLSESFANQGDFFGNLGNGASQQLGYRLGGQNAAQALGGIPTSMVSGTGWPQTIYGANVATAAAYGSETTITGASTNVPPTSVWGIGPGAG